MKCQHHEINYEKNRGDLTADQRLDSITKLEDCFEQNDLLLPYLDKKVCNFTYDYEMEVNGFEGDYQLFKSSCMAGEGGLTQND